MPSFLRPLLRQLGVFGGYRTLTCPSGLVCDGTVQISSPVSVLKMDETGREVSECAHCTVVLHTLHINYKYSWHLFIYFTKTGCF